MNTERVIKLITKMKDASFDMVATCQELGKDTEAQKELRKATTLSDVLYILTDETFMNKMCEVYNV